MKDLLFFLSLFKPYKWWLVSGVFLALLTSMASITLLTLSGWFITAAAIAGILAPDGVAITFNFMQPAAEIRALAIIRTGARYAERVVTHEATFRVLAEIRCWFFAKLIPLSPGHLAKKRSADLLASITQDIDTLDSLYLRLCLPFLMALIGGGAVVIFIASYSVQISLIVLFVFLMTTLLIPWVFSYFGRQSAKQIVENMAEFKVGQIEIIQGISDLIAFDGYQRFKHRLVSISEQLLATQSKNNQWSALSSAITTFLSQMTVLVTIVISGVLYQQGGISGAVLVMLSFCVLAMFELLTPLSSSVQLLFKTQSAANRLRQFADQTNAITEPEQPRQVPENGDIKISNLSFRYTEQTDWILKGVNLNIPQGSKIAIVGNSGAGKTTLLHLLLRFYNLQQGEIEYAGIDTMQFQSDQLMQQFAILSQHTQLFSASIKENLLIAKPDASDTEIMEAIKMARLETYVSQLTDGVDTWVGEHGLKVSGGEGRRIALARVYLKNAPVLLLDEPTEGLDKETESHVLNSLEKIAKNKTLIMVTHRKAGLRLVDTIYRINGGELYQ